MNFYKVCHIKRCNNIYKDRIFIKENILKMKKITSSYKDYGQDNTL